MVEIWSELDLKGAVGSARKETPLHRCFDSKVQFQLSANCTGKSTIRYLSGTYGFLFTFLYFGADLKIASSALFLRQEISKSL